MVGDHQPPNKTVYGSTANAQAAAAAATVQRAVLASNPAAPALWEAFAPAGVKRLFAPAKVKQRFYPQCSGCSQLQARRGSGREALAWLTPWRQADAMRRAVKKLVPHFGGVQPFAYAGALTGLRHYGGPGERARGPSLERWLAEAQRALDRGRARW